jgi:triacylglycerol lipase
LPDQSTGGVSVSAPMKLYWWALDYAFVIGRQLCAFWLQTPPAQFRLAAAASNDYSPTVVLLPGIYERWQFLLPLAVRLERSGFRVAVLPELGWNAGDIDIAAELVLNSLAAANLSNVVIVAHSKGGLIGKAAMVLEAERRADGANLDPIQPSRIRHLIAIATPFAGSRYADYLPGRQLRAFAPANPTLVRLGLSAAINTRITSIYGLFDPHIPGGSLLPGATNIVLPVSGHFRVLETAQLRAALDQELSRVTSPE